MFYTQSTIAVISGRLLMESTKKTKQTTTATKATTTNTQKQLQLNNLDDFSLMQQYRWRQHARKGCVSLAACALTWEKERKKERKKKEKKNEKKCGLSNIMILFLFLDPFSYFLIPFLISFISWSLFLFLDPFSYFLIPGACSFIFSLLLILLLIFFSIIRRKG